MPPLLALIITLCFIAWLLKNDFACREAGSVALFIPGIWIAIAGTRPVSSWFEPHDELATVRVTLDGNPVNTYILAAIIIAALFVLQSRGLDWGEVIRGNKAVFTLYLFFALSALWSTESFTSLKRLMKDFGSVPVLLVFLTEVNPPQAVRTVFIRVAYFLFPLSLLCGRYFPSIGRGYGIGGEPMFTGLSDQKNSLGQVAMVFGLVILYDLLELRSGQRSRKTRRLAFLDSLMLLLGIWILVASNSKTALVCMLIGVGILFGARRAAAMRNGRQVLVTCLVVAMGIMVLNKVTGLSSSVAQMLGRDPTLTGRSQVWEAIKAQDSAPFLGEGFSIFWNTEKGKAVAAVVGPINTAHNGYLEMFLDGGLVGETLLMILLVAASKRAVDWIMEGRPMSELGLVFLGAAILHNCSETSFFRLSALWFVFLLMLMEVPQRLLRITPPLNRSRGERALNTTAPAFRI